MNMILAHTLVLMNMLRAEGMVFTEDHPYREEQHRCRDKSYDEYNFHFCIQNSMQRYKEKLKDES